MLEFLLSAPLNIDPAYFDLIGHHKHFDIDEHWLFILAVPKQN